MFNIRLLIKKPESQVFFYRITKRKKIEYKRNVKSCIVFRSGEGSRSCKSRPIARGEQRYLQAIVHNGGTITIMGDIVGTRYESRGLGYTSSNIVAQSKNDPFDAPFVGPRAKTTHITPFTLAFPTYICFHPKQVESATHKSLRSLFGRQ